ncbi:MAG: tRNA preQ1(34) S-adenosylmethionine ribosyltransferase-isomerase QueA [Planctomycetota bacterium]
MQLSDFDFDLPATAIADRPSEPRSASRLLVHDRAACSLRHLRAHDLPGLLEPGDLCVFNDTRVLPHRLVGQRTTGARVEVLILRRDGLRCEGFVKPLKKLRGDVSVPLEGGMLELRPLPEESVGLDGGRLCFELHPGEAADHERLRGADDPTGVVLEQVGRAPLPPYIARPDDEDPSIDRERYQTLFAARPGAVAAPTAGLHFDEELLQGLEDRGVRQARVTLHVGEGTFAPVRVDEVEDHRMHAEVFELPEATKQAIDETRARGRRVVAIGTTSARVLESCARDDGQVEARHGSTRLFLRPGRRFRVVDALWTNFHLPESTLLMMLATFTGHQRMLAVYREAVRNGYRFFSYGDVSLWL